MVVRERPRQKGMRWEIMNDSMNGGTDADDDSLYEKVELYVSGAVQAKYCRKSQDKGLVLGI